MPVFFLFLFLLFSPAAFALGDTFAVDLFEKTWPRANTACNFKNKRIEVLIRGGSKFTEFKEKGFGEYVFYKVDERVEVFNFSRSQSSLYRFYRPSPDSSCAKSLGFPLEGDKFAILIGEENKPHGEKLIIQLFDFKTMRPLENIVTNMLVEKAFARPGGFIFKSFLERTDMDMGHVQFGKDKFTYQDRVYPVWMKYSLKGFEIDPVTTFEKLPWRKYFKDQSDFYQASAWDPEKKVFKKPIVYFAVKHSANKKCVLFMDMNKKRLTSAENWRCI